MKIVAFVAKHTGIEFAESILTNGDDIQLVIGNEDRNSIVEFCMRNSLQYQFIEDFDFSKCLDKEFDWLLNLWSPFIFKDIHLIKAKKTLNIHPSLLPSCRGRDPIVHGLLNQEKLGFTFHVISVGIDEGPIIFQKEVNYTFPFKADEIYAKVVREAIMNFKLEWPRIRHGDFELIRQEQISSRTNTRAHTENLRLKKWQDLSPDQKDVLLWMSSFDFKNDYGPLLEVNGKTFKISISYSQSEENHD